MKGRVKRVGDELQLILKPQGDLDKKFLLNAFYSIKVGCLSSAERDVQSLVLWTDKTHRLPRRRK